MYIYVTVRFIPQQYFCLLRRGCVGGGHSGTARRRARSRAKVTFNPRVGESRPRVSDSVFSCVIIRSMKVREVYVKLYKTMKKKTCIYCSDFKSRSFCNTGTFCRFSGANKNFYTNLSITQTTKSSLRTHSVV